MYIQLFESTGLAVIPIHAHQKCGDQVLNSCLNYYSWDIVKPLGLFMFVKGQWTVKRHENMRNPLWLPEPGSRLRPYFVYIFVMSRNFFFNKNNCACVNYQFARGNAKREYSMRCHRYFRRKAKMTGGRGRLQRVLCTKYNIRGTVAGSCSKLYLAPSSFSPNQTLFLGLARTRYL